MYGGTDGSIVMVYRPIMLPDEQGTEYARIFSVPIDASNYWRITYGSNGDNNISLITYDGVNQKIAASPAEPLGTSRYSLHSLIDTITPSSLHASSPITILLTA